MGSEVLLGKEVFLFTDKWVFKKLFYKGHSVSKQLLDVILRLNQAQRNGLSKCHVIHVAGTRMKAWGVDGLSRRDTFERLMAGQDPLLFIPLGESALT